MAAAKDITMQSGFDDMWDGAITNEGKLIQRGGGRDAIAILKGRGMG